MVAGQLERIDDPLEKEFEILKANAIALLTPAHATPAARPRSNAAVTAPRIAPPGPPALPPPGAPAAGSRPSPPPVTRPRINAVDLPRRPRN